MKIELPGLFDLQVNGFGGVDFNNPSTDREDVLRVIERIRETGVTRFLPTLITSSLERFTQCAHTLLATDHPAIAGIHMEGPYISREDGPRGAHPQEHVQSASIEDFQRRQDAAQGTIRLLTLAPEVAGALRLIEYAVEHGVRVAIGHTAAEPEQIRAAVKAGATLSTHLGNGCAQHLPRHPNLIWEQLAADGLFASLIIDGHHLPPATVKTMIRSKTSERSILITDAMAAAGCAPGNYELNGEAVVLARDGRVAAPGKPWLAGSSLRLDQAVVNTVKFTGLSLETAWDMASTRPAAYLGRQPAGRISLEWNPAEHELARLKIEDDCRKQGSS
jgi:N-acetylglucosamine-6-phosphate deacetylase